MSREIWIVAERGDRELHEATMEILGEGRQLADQLESELAAVLMGWNVAEFTSELMHYGANKVYLAEHELLANYTTDGYTQVLTSLIEEFAPDMVVLGATPNGRDLAPRVAACLRTGFVANCLMLKINKEGVLEMTQPIFDDRVYRTVVCPSAHPLIVTVLPGALGRAVLDASRRGDLVIVPPKLTPADIRTRVLRSIEADPKTLPIEEAEVLVVGGYGVGITKWHLIEELAECLGGGVGGTRKAMDAGWISLERLIGQTGKSVKPKVCIEAGVSGAIQHTAGLRDARLTIAINKDRNAPILKIADVGIIADLHELIPSLISTLRKLQISEPSGDKLF